MDQVPPHCHECRDHARWVMTIDHGGDFHHAYYYCSKHLKERKRSISQHNKVYPSIINIEYYVWYIGRQVEG